MRKFWNTICALFYLLKTILTPFKSEGNKQFLIFLLFLLISTMFWFLQSLNNKDNVNVSIPVEYVNIPKDIIFTKEPPSTIDVVLRDKGINLINYSLGRVKPIEINFSELTKNRGRIVIPHDKLLSIVDGEINSSSELIDVYCDSLVLLYGDKKGVHLPISLNSNITISSNCIRNGEIQVTPSEVELYADSAISSNIKSVETELLSLHNITDTVVAHLNIKPIEGAKIVPEQVKVMIPVEELISKKITLSIQSANFPKDVSVMTFPATADVEFLVPLTLFPEANASLFSVVVDYRQFKKNISKLPLRLLKYPDYIKNPIIMPDSVEYIIDKKIVNIEQSGILSE